MLDGASDVEEFCELVGIPFDAPLFSSQLQLSETDGSVVILGLTSRGKSTLVNELCGLSLCPVDARAETIATQRISSGIPTATGRLDTGEPVAMNTDPKEFSARLSRAVIPNVVHAEFVGVTRLPDGIALVDTPGVNDGLRHEVWTRWRSVPAAGAVVVVSVPGAFSKRDRLVIEEAEKIFGEQVVIVVKATDSQVINTDITAIAELVSEQTGLESIVIPNGVGTDSWGRGKTADLDIAIEKLVRQAERSARRAADRVSDMLELVATFVARVDSSRLSQLRRSLVVAKRISPEVASAVRARIAQIMADEVDANRRAQMEAETHRQSVLSKEVDLLVDLLPRPEEIEVDLHREAIAELLDLIDQGSETATVVVARYASVHKTKGRALGLDMQSVVGRFGWVLAAQILRDYRFDEAEVEVVSQLDNPEILDCLGQGNGLRQMLRHKSLTYLSSLHKGARSTAMRDLIMDAMCLSRLDELLAAIDESRSVADISNMRLHLDQLQNLGHTHHSGLQAALRRTNFSEMFSGVELAARQRACRILERRRDDILENSIRNDEEKLLSELDALRETLDWLAVSPDSQIVEEMKRGGRLELWLSTCMDLKTRAHHQVRHDRVLGSTFFVLSILTVVAVGAVFWRGDPPNSLAWAIVAGAIGIGLSWNDVFDPTPWTHYFRQPRYENVDANILMKPFDYMTQ